jgi:hypothetical protein
VHWLGEIDAGSLKIKVASTIVAISSIHLLQIFLNVDKYTGEQADVVHADPPRLRLLGAVPRLHRPRRGDDQVDQQGKPPTAPQIVTATGVAVTAARSRPAQIVRAVAVLLLLIKLYLTLVAPPIGDEAYYWMWGQKPDWSYLDHPPLMPGCCGVVERASAGTYFSLRCPNLAHARRHAYGSSGSGPGACSPRIPLPGGGRAPRSTSPRRCSS